MSYIHFNKEQLSDLKFSSGREILLTNRNGAYCSTTIANYNTRKYHGLLIAPQSQFDNDRYVLLSSLDETIIKPNSVQPVATGHHSIQLATHRYPDTYHPDGYRHLESFEYKLAPTWIIKTEDIEISKEVLMVNDEDRVLIRYTVNKADTPFELRFDPFLSFRNIHSLSKANMDGNKKSEKLDNGMAYKLYNGFTNLFLQFSRKPEIVTAPDWYYNVEYACEQERGYDYKEDLFAPGYFKITLKKGDTLVFSAGVSEISPRKLNHLFKRELNNQNQLNTFEECLENAATQFIVHTSPYRGLGVEPQIMAGYHWFGAWGRDTFISLPGLTLSLDNPELCRQILDSNLKNLKDGLFPNVGSGENAAYNSADASLWFIWALQQYTLYTETMGDAWDDYGDAMKLILENYRKGTPLTPNGEPKGYINMEYNGLLYTGKDGIALTWMDAVVDGKPVTPRTGFAVELNALWYNAIRFAIQCAEYAEDKNFVMEWESLSQQIEVSFLETFWEEEKGYLADYVNGSHHDWSIRPNQVIAASLPFSVINDEIKKSVLAIVAEKLLTPRGLRTLSTDDKNYKGIYGGDTSNRDSAYHQGTVWPWLLGHFAEACLKTDGEKNKELVQSVYENFAPAILEYGIGSIAEIYDGDAPHNPKGAISQAWSVAELLRIRKMLAGHLLYKAGRQIPQPAWSADREETVMI